MANAATASEPCRIRTSDRVPGWQIGRDRCLGSQAAISLSLAEVRQQRIVFWIALASGRLRPWLLSFGYPGDFWTVGLRIDRR
jgi:hypothetical protein